MSAPTPSPRKIPFRGLSGRGWTNLAVAGLLLFYVAQAVLDIAWGNLFGNLGIDFASFWSAGLLANQHGYGAVYDLENMAQIQRQLLPDRAAALTNLGVIPTPYLPIFIIPFQLLALLPPPLAAGVWIALTMAGSALYLHHFAVRLAGRPVDRRLLILIMASVPIFLNWFAGQVNLWLMICVGEFLVLSMSEKPWQSGLWLAGLLLKPQSLILVAPAILLQRRTRTALGMFAGGAVIIGASWLLAGSEAMIRLARLWLGYAGGLPTNDPQLMMNWRMIGFHLENLVGAGLASVVVILGIAGTAAAALAMWFRPLHGDRLRFIFASLGLFAATGVVAWHSHAHMAMLLIPAILAAAMAARDQFDRALERWILLPAALYVVRVVLAAAMQVTGSSDPPYALLDLLAGIGLFSTNLALLVWALRQLKPPLHPKV